MSGSNLYIAPDGRRGCRECRKLYERERRAGGRHTGWRKIRHRILERDEYTCAIGAVFGLEDQCSGGLQVHHKIPVAKGGGNEEENLYTVCQAHHWGVHRVLRLAEKEKWDEWKPCPHPPGTHRYAAGKEACERRLNRHLTRAA